MRRKNLHHNLSQKRPDFRSPYHKVLGSQIDRLHLNKKKNVDGKTPRRFP